MINKHAQKKIKKELKSGENGYCETIAIYLRKNKIFNVKGEEFSESMIRLMLTKPISHARLEAAIYDCFEAHVKERKIEEKRREDILKTV